MSPRPYRAGERRQAATEATRDRIISATRELLTDPQAKTFSIEAIAVRADVARMTVYYQFKSKGKLLEALFDDFATRANMRDMRKVFQEPDPVRSLRLLVAIFCNLWETESPLLRRLTVFAALDPDVDKTLRARGDWRREALSNLVSRFKIPNAEADDVIDLLHVLTSFETYDALVHAHRQPKKIVKLLQKAALAIVAA
jgi:AcrR family transcriptional regulator